MQKATFKTGTYQFHHLPMFDYQLNRLVMWNAGDADAVSSVAGQIRDFNSWQEVLVNLSQDALKEERLNAASGYLRMAEFFMDSSTPEAKTINARAKKLFYQHYGSLFCGENPVIKRAYVPYDQGYLHCWQMQSQQTQKQGTILFHGGHDSLIEEFINPFLYFSEHGFDIIFFEGPGQGETLRRYGLTFTHQWEKPVTCVLDYFGVSSVTVIGVSLGAMLAPRAAAFEKRIKRIATWGVLPSMYDSLMLGKPPEVRRKLELLLLREERDKICAIYEEMAKKAPLVQWSVNHCNYAYGTESVYDYLQLIREYTIEPVADKVTQDFLLIGAKQDQMAEFSEYSREIDLLHNTNSLSFLALGKETDAGSHCNIGNTKLVLDAIIKWTEWLRTYTK